MNTKIQSFTDLNAWKEAHKLVLQIYNITKSFPQEEKFSLIDQMKRCSVSISSNISEGFSRKTSKEKAQFFYMALGSLTELQNQLLISRDLSYINSGDFTQLADKTIVISKLVNGLIKSSKQFNT